MSDNARLAALTALERCRRSGAWSSTVLDAVITKYELDKRSAALASTIFLGVMQNVSLLDHCIDKACTSKGKIEPKVRDILRCAVYQIAFMDKIPVNAAVNEAVEQCKKLGYSRASGFVNAVLRKISLNREAALNIGNRGTPEYLSVRYSHPLWLCEYMVKHHGYEFAECFFYEDNREPQTTVQVNSLKTTAPELLAKLSESGVDAKPHPWLENCLIVKGNVTTFNGFDEGLFYVQDPAARSAVTIAELKPGMQVLDACAAPGGKSFAAAIDMQNRGSILSCDLHEKKLSLINHGAQRLGIEIITTQARDARSTMDDKFDAIIADVPCSGYGVIRKKPDIRFKPETDRLSLPDIQYAILDNLSDALKPDGTLIYSTCTVFREENEDVVNRFLAGHPDFETVRFTLPTGKAAAGMYTFWPHIDGTDGFFVCKLRRKQ